MAWGYWTTYSTYAIRQNGRENNCALSPPSKRERSLERESRERERHAQGDSGSRTPGSYGVSSSGGSGAGSLAHRPYQTNHVEAEKVAFERRLLLGDPDWSSRTAADRNTLPRKKAPFYERGSMSDGIYVKNSHHSPATTPVDSVSRKSDDLFCPACAQHSASQQSNNRDSRVSFGSVASSSRGSRGSSSARGGSAAIPIPMRSRSRSHDDDERSSYSQGVGGGHSTGNFSSSLPTPPPPPFSSQRDILQQHTALMETINQKISVLSSLKSKYNTMAVTGSNHYNYHTNSRPDHEPDRKQQQHRRSASNVRPEEFVVGSLEHSSSSLHEGGADSLRRRSEGAPKSTGASRSTGRKSSRKSSSGSRTPRGHSGSASSRRSRESVGSSDRKAAASTSSTNVSARHRSSSERVDDDYGEDRDAGDEESDEVDNNQPGGHHKTRSASSTSPKLEPVHRESLEKVIARQVVAVAAAAVAAKAGRHQVDQQLRRNSVDHDEPEIEDYGTVRRRMRRKSKEDHLSSLEDDRHHTDPAPSGGAQLVGGSLRSSQSQTPEDEDSTEARRFSCKRHGSGRSRAKNRADVSPHTPEELPKPPVAAQSVAPPPFSLSIKKSSVAGRKGSSSNGTSSLPPPQPPQVFHHFKHYDHKDQGDLRTVQPVDPDRPPAPLPIPLPPPLPKRGDECCRPRSASIGNHLSDVDAENVTDYHSTSTFPHRREGRTSSRRHHTLDGYSRAGEYSEHRSSNRYADDHEEYFQGRHGGATPGGCAGIASSHSVSSKSEKSSRSSQSPSVENLRHGKIFSSEIQGM